MKNVFIAGIDGYLGWPLSLYLISRGYSVSGCDVFHRRTWVEEIGSQSATPITRMQDRLSKCEEVFGKKPRFYYADLLDGPVISDIIEKESPDAIVHLAEMPSAPFSMIDADHCNLTHVNNLVGTLNLLHAMKKFCPDTHLVKLGTMGEYGTPNVDIPEGFFEIEYRGRKDILPFPRQPGSWYHLTKVHDSNNILFACKVWGLRSTDIMQGVVYGARIPEMQDDELLTRFDFDEHFGTAINRFCAQAVIEHPLTPFGKGHQRRGFLPLKDSMQCLTLAIDNPPEHGEYRTFNQFEETYNVYELADKVKNVALEIGVNAKVRHVENPRVEMEEHYYNPDHQHLLDLGYIPTRDMDKEIKNMLLDLLQFKDRIKEKKELLIPETRWSGEKRKSKFI